VRISGLVALVRVYFFSGEKLRCLADCIFGELRCALRVTMGMRNGGIFFFRRLALCLHERMGYFAIPGREHGTLL